MIKNFITNTMASINVDIIKKEVPQILQIIMELSMTGGDLFTYESTLQVIKFLSSIHYNLNVLNQKYYLIEVLDIIGNIENCMNDYTDK